jgi:flagellar motor switch protein FliG
LKFNGKDEALKLIKALSPSEAQKIIGTIAISDPDMARFLKENLVELEDLQYLTQTMLMSLLRDVNLETFGYAIKPLDQKIIEKIMSQVSAGIKLDIEDGLKSGPCPVEKIQKSQDKVLELLNKKIANGQVVIDPNEKYI